MRIKYLFSTVAAFVLMIIVALNSYGQNRMYKHAFGINQDYSDFNVNISAGKFTSFDSSLATTTRLSYLRYLGRSWELNVGISNGVILNQYQEDVYVSRSYSFGLDFDILFKLNNGRILKEESRLAPYLSFGYNFNSLPGFKEAGLPGTSLGNEYGVGMKIRLGEWSAINVQTAVSQQLTGDFDTYVQYRFGFVQTLGKKKEKIKELEKPGAPDYDNDGIADNLDACPTIAGLILYKGCPTDPDDNSTGFIQDSLIAELDKRDIEIIQMQKEIEALRKEEQVSKQNALSQETEKYKSPIKKEVQTNVEKDTVTQALVKNHIQDNGKTEKLSQGQTFVRVPESEKGGLSIKDVETEVTTTAVENKTPIKSSEKQKVITTAKEEKDLNSESLTREGFYIIVASSKNRAYSEKLAEDLGREYPTVRVLPQPNGYFRVGIYGTKDRTQANKILTYAKSNGIDAAWIAHEPTK